MRRKCFVYIELLANGELRPGMTFKPDEHSMLLKATRPNHQKVVYCASTPNLLEAVRLRRTLRSMLRDEIWHLIRESNPQLDELFPVTVPNDFSRFFRLGPDEFPDADASGGVPAWIPPHSPGPRFCSDAKEWPVEHEQLADACLRR